MTIRQFALPDLGEGLTESEIVAWHVAEGETVALNQVIADIETDKALVELPSPHAGRVTRLYVPAGTTVEVGTPIVAFEIEDPASAPNAASPDSGPAQPDAAPPNLVGYGAGVESALPARRPRHLPAADQPPAAVSTEALPTSAARRAAPPIRKLAEQLGVDLATLHGTGEDGLITRADVEAVAALQSAPSPDPGAEPHPEVDTVIPVRGVRKLTAEAVMRSAFTAPHVTVFLTVDVTRTITLLDELRASPAFRNVRLTFLAAVAKASCSALRRTPAINSRWDEGGDTITQFARVGLGIAAATPRGLLVPVVADADTLDLAALANALSELARTAKAGTTSPAEMVGGTFTISNVGVFGVDGGTPIIHAGQAAILAVGAVVRRPWEWQNEIALRHVVTLSLSFDHRVLDGEEASRFLADVGRLLDNPASAFAL